MILRLLCSCLMLVFCLPATAALATQEEGAGLLASCLESMQDGGYAAHRERIEQCLAMPPDAMQPMDRAMLLFSKAEYHATQQPADADATVIAMAAVNDAIAAAPANGTVYLYAGAVHKRLGNATAQEQVYSQGLDAVPDQYDLYILRGYARADLGNMTQALEDFSSYIEQSPTPAKGYFHRAIVQSKMEQLDAAMEDLEQATTLDPTSAKAQYWMGLVADALGQQERALAAWSKTLEINPNQPKAHMRRGKAYRLLGNMDAAAADYRAALAFGPEKLPLPYLMDLEGPSALYERAITTHKDDPEAAIADLTLAIALQPNSAIFYEVRGALKNTLGDTEGAAEDIRTAQAINAGELQFTGQGSQGPASAAAPAAQSAPGSPTDPAPEAAGVEQSGNATE